MRKLSNFIFVFPFLCIALSAQVTEIDRLIASEFKMTFPSIYFKHNSTEYAAMPYTTDSCYRCIAEHFNADVTQLVIWRDSSEAEELTTERIVILKAGISKYKHKGRVRIESMGGEQKVSRHTINLANDSVKINYLLSMNSVMDFSNTNFPVMKKKKGDHVMHPRINCIRCWQNGFHVIERHKRKKRAKLKSK